MSEKETGEMEMGSENPTPAKRRLSLVQNWRISVLVIWIVSMIAPVWAQSDSPISFAKKEIAFFKWGNEPNEVGVIQIKSGGTKFEKKTGQVVGEIKTIVRPGNGALHIDADDNLYFSNGKDGIFVVSDDGGVIKKIDSDDWRNFCMVDAQGNIYFRYSKQGKFYSEKGKSFGFVMEKKDGTRVLYRNLDLGYVENGVAYPSDIFGSDNEQPLTLYGVNLKKSKKLPVHLSFRDQGVERKGDGSFVIRTKKLNERLAEIGKKISPDEIFIKLDKKLNVAPFSFFLGVADNGNSYFLCGYSDTPPST
ncbi:MAG: hypothetical protein ACRDFB_02735, partial [Rhabdochlamydiaceae bacterium]